MWGVYSLLWDTVEATFSKLFTHSAIQKSVRTKLWIIFHCFQTKCMHAFFILFCHTYSTTAKTLYIWTNETERVLQACLDLTDWSVFEAAATDLDELTETVTSYISFCEDVCIPTRTHLTYNNDKLQNSDSSVRPKKMLTGRGTESCINRANTHWKRRSVAKRNYSEKLRIQFTSSDSASVWKCLKDITNYKTPSPSTVENQQLADDLNEFYWGFEKTPHTHSEHLSTQPLTPPATPLSPTPAIQISEDEVRQVFRKQKMKKAQITQIFNRSLELCDVPSCLKRSTIIPIQKKPKITGLNDLWL